MFPTFGQEFSTHGVPQNKQSIQLLIEQLRATVHADLRNLTQPLFPMACGIDLLAGAANSPAVVQRLEPIFDAFQVLADGQITTC